MKQTLKSESRRLATDQSQLTRLFQLTDSLDDFITVSIKQLVQGVKFAHCLIYFLAVLG